MKRFIVCLILAAGCESTPDAIPVPSGSVMDVKGTATIKIGPSGTPILVTDDLEELCLLDTKGKTFADGARVEFIGKKQAVLPLAKEQCMKFEPTSVELISAPAPAKSK